MPIAIWPPGNPVRFSYWDRSGNNRRSARRSLGVVVEAEYRAGGYVEIQDLTDLTTHRFQFGDEGDYRPDAFPRAHGYGEPVEVQAESVRMFLDESLRQERTLARSNAHRRMIDYLRHIGREDCLV